MLSGLAGPDDVDENDDFPDTVMPSALCESSEGLVGELVRGNDAALNGDGPWVVLVFDLLARTADAMKLCLSLPSCERCAIGGGCGTAAAMISAEDGGRAVVRTGVVVHAVELS